MPTLHIDEVAALFKVEPDEILNLVADRQLTADADGQFTEAEVRAFIDRNTYRAA